jgi:hypothetical protein
MTIDTLKHLRRITPAAIIIVYSLVLGQIIGWWKFPLPKLSDLGEMPVPIIIGLLYYITPLRERVNSVHHNLIIELLRSKIVSITGRPDNADLYTWKRLKPLFYKFVDNDKSLTIIASRAYDNGFAWTTFADLTVLALVFSLFCVILWYFDVNSALIALGVFLTWSLICHWGSLVTTKKQIAIGEEQIDVIKTMYANEVKTFFNDLEK